MEKGRRKNTPRREDFVKKKQHTRMEKRLISLKVIILAKCQQVFWGPKTRHVFSIWFCSFHPICGFSLASVLSSPPGTDSICCFRSNAQLEPVSAFKLPKRENCFMNQFQRALTLLLVGALFLSTVVRLRDAPHLHLTAAHSYLGNLFPQEPAFHVAPLSKRGFFHP